MRNLKKVVFHNLNGKTIVNSLNEKEKLPLDLRNYLLGTFLGTLKSKTHVKRGF